MVPVITRRLEFDAAHRVLRHESKCKAIHGHRYRVEVSVAAPALDSLDRVVDFGVVKEKLGGWIDEYWDHNILLNSEDPLLAHRTDKALFVKAPYVFNSANPTAEIIAMELHRIAVDLLIPLTVVKVRVYETPNCWADFPC